MTELDKGERRWALGLLALVLVLSMSTWFSATAVLPQLDRVFDLSSSAQAGLTIAVQVGFVVGALLSSLVNLPDVLSPQRVVSWGSVGAATVNIGLVWAGGPTAAIVLRFLTGLFLAGVYPPALKLMATWYSRGRGTALGLMVGALTVGSALPHLVNGLGGVAWEPVIALTSLLTVAGGLIAGLAIREGPFPFPRAVFDPRQVGRSFANRGVRLASFGYFGHMWELYAMWGWFLVFFNEAIARSGNPSTSLAPVVTFAVIGIGGLGCWIGGVMGDRWGRSRTTILMMAVSGACAIAVGPLLGGPIWLLIAVSLVWGLTVVADSAQFSTVVTEVAEQAYVGTALTMQLAVGFSLTVATLWLIPLVEGVVGWSWAFSILAVGPLLGIWAMLRLSRLPVARQIAGGLG